MQKVKTYVFQWVGGGYNTVFAINKKEAIKLAKALGAPHEYQPGRMTRGLVPREDTFTTKKSVRDALDKAFAGCMD